MIIRITLLAFLVYILFRLFIFSYLTVKPLRILIFFLYNNPRIAFDVIFFFILNTVHFMIDNNLALITFLNLAFLTDEPFVISLRLRLFQNRFMLCKHGLVLFNIFNNFSIFSTDWILLNCSY